MINCWLQLNFLSIILHFRLSLMNITAKHEYQIQIPAILPRPKFGKLERKPTSDILN